MGLDIILCAIVQDDFDLNSSQEHQLSRTFCTLMCQHSDLDDESELDQIGRLVGVDISPLYEMESYVLDAELESELEFTDEEDKQALIERVESDRAALVGNIDKVSTVVEVLIVKLSTISNLSALLVPRAHDVLNSKIYFADFLLDKGDGYIGNNFGRDLRNFKRFLTYAKREGSRTVFFNYG
jgi:hypothetical protein